MKYSRIVGVLFPVIAIIVVWIFWFGGGDKHYVDVYIGGDCLPYTMEQDLAIETLFVFKGDYVIWNNTASGEVDLDFPEGMFEEDEVTIPAKQRVILKVLGPGDGSPEYTIKCTGGSATPKVEVGEEP